ncbi:MAG TPA: D-glycero-beta-D-manno-heptose 1-phosphate adenylyltransferase [Candidatus Sumerlaeota bacterium]|nr:D-glycero-beta-D-manno-heptose 1-phosphate adenylyltransferase [Candidatus Sumerlaeota bacterium]HRR30752.1 D-glycero-beta-D-manno-heptose 1-phosphate adenylyltransferase [Candidatus Sumerlaeia bacterium]HON50112.1 D-glycero-beta-D-manno-heptose 1-phosphate adenylyltransferase [Candidatus Sumerlaeota bacterium]HOR63328.1 D-glycero-beta-D-manno-heptose 1-phosphate adenylyltransferase [Candidatus Sumerlaeota bacterium]HPL74079.1 D-glycero-beta-D-manno-heptose 1-phosphate adenylyltransferase [C
MKAQREKIIQRNEAIDIVRKLKAENKRIVFTNGCFDLIHVGHVRLLQEARNRGDCLIVGLNTDASIRRIKGDKRPLLDESQRGRIVAAFESVDYVLFFDEDTPEELIREIKPDVLVKGGDYTMEAVAGRQEVWDAGGEVILYTPVPGRSTSAIIENIVERFS